MSKDELLTMQEVARYLRVDQATTRRWAHNGVLDVVKLPMVGKNVQYRMRRSALEKLLGKGK
jgi:excisionase family DNA binding protein